MKVNNNELLSDRTPAPDLMTEQELILFLRISEVSKAKDYHNVVKNLIRMHDLPRIQICKRLLFPKKAILDWVEKETIKASLKKFVGYNWLWQCP